MRKLISFGAALVDDPKLILRYVGVGATAAGVEFILFTNLYQLMELPLLLANSIAFSVAVIYCFLMQKILTFRARGAANRQLRLYLLMQLISGILNNFLVLTFITGFGLNAPLSKILQIGIVFFWNYTFCRLVVFSPERAKVID